jgi:hypothetical protein
MRVVSNTSPLSNLAVIGRPEFLQRRYGEIVIPSEVALELSALSHSAARSQIQSALAQGWLRIANAPAPLPRLSLPLDAGETAAISLALSVAADLILIDEKRGRAAARAAGLHMGGLLGELLHAKQQG